MIQNFFNFLHTFFADCSAQVRPIEKWFFGETGSQPEVSGGMQFISIVSLRSSVLWRDCILATLLYI